MTEQDQPIIPSQTPAPSPLETEPAPPPMAAAPADAPKKPGRTRQIITWVVILGFLAVVLYVVRNQVSADDLKVGQCFNVPDSNEVSTVEKFDCTAAHDAEVFHVVEYTGGGDNYPISLTFDNFVDDQCGPAFETYVGADLSDRLDLGMGYFYPSSDTWGDGDRTITCYTGKLDKSKLTKSLKGSGAGS